MSHIATAWAMSVRGIKPGEFRVLMALADCHNPARGCFPSSSYLRDVCEMSNGALYDNLDRLEEKGLITRVRRGNLEGLGRAPSYYILRMDAPQIPENGNKPDSGEAEIAPPQIPENGDPNSGAPEREPVREPGRIEEPVSSMSSGDDPPAKPIDEIAMAVTAYNDAARASGWPQVQSITRERRSKLAARLKEDGGLGGWAAALAKAQASEMCCGGNDRGWVANFDFLTRKSSFTKLMEGNYDNRTSTTGRSGPNRPGSDMARAFANVAQRRGQQG